MKKLKTIRKKIIVDTITPVSIYLKLRDQFTNTILLESSDYIAKDNSYAYICCNPIAKFYVKKNILFKEFPDNSKKETKLTSTTNILSELDDFMRTFEIDDNSVESKKYISKGLFGYMSYDSIKFFENIEVENDSYGDEIPEIFYSFYREIIVINTFNNEATLISHSGDIEKINTLEKLIKTKKTNEFSFKIEGEIKSNLKDNEYLEMVKKGIKHCFRGDVFQIVLSRKFSQKFSGDEFCVYRQLRSINPSPYLFYFDYGNFKIFGSSPEAQLVIKDEKAEIHPIAGTFKRTGNDLIDSKKAKKLFQDEKENSEHMMLVDLARNDLSRSCNNVKVEKDREIQFYSHVIHLVSKVTGKLKSISKNIIGNTFPAGTLTGAPKHKAMNLIEKYEKNNRSFYGGAIGFIDFENNYNHAIIIRSFLSKDQNLFLQAGAGIVSKSNPENELNEVYNKIGALLKALKKAEEI
ncbi:MAG: anthranilate synthase component I family protein [Flavobacteriaceae bacterium]|tara:strand:- start:760 stop:2154 length:1395 start_codon:yes stop_codon:yes gene_type:complete